LIRFWEKELGVIQLKKNKKGNRLFTLSDIEKLKTIYTLVKQKGFTLQGAKNVISGKSNIQALSSNDDVLSKLQKLKSQLLELAKEL
jgi:DNA-binding transcriptional MerR regulator